MATDPNAPAPSASVEQLQGGGLRVTPSGDPQEQQAKEAQAAGGTAPELKEGEAEAPKLPEGYESWETYGKDVASGKVKPAEAGPAAKEEPKGGPTKFETKLAPYNAEFQEKGALSDESVTKAAADFGVSEDMVRQYIAGGLAEATAAQAPFFEQTGGEANYREFQTWASEGMTEAEQAELNEAYEKGGPGALAAQQKFVDRWKAEGNGKAPQDLTREGKSGAGSDGDLYESWAQVKADMGNPLYDSDSAFRQKVSEKIARSPNI